MEECDEMNMIALDASDDHQDLSRYKQHPQAASVHHAPCSHLLISRCVFLQYGIVHLGPRAC